MTVTTIARWEAADTTLPEVEQALNDVRRAEVRAAVRTAVVTLVVVADDDTCHRHLDTISEMADVNPSHAIVVVAGDEDAPFRCDADVRVHALPRDGRAVCFEDVLLRIQGRAVRHLDSVVEPFTLADLPIVLWTPERVLEPDDPLLGVADRLIVDSRNVDVAALRDIADLARRLPVTDLSWVRLQPWRELLAGLFEGAEFRPFLTGVHHVAIHGKVGPRRMLGGWILSRLALSPDTIHLHDADHVTIELDAAVEGRTGRFRVARPTDDRIVEAGAEVAGGPAHSRTLRLRDRSAARVLTEAIARTGRDRVYEQSLAAADLLSPPGP